MVLNPRWMYTKLCKQFQNNETSKQERKQNQTKPTKTVTGPTPDQLNLNPRDKVEVPEFLKASQIQAVLKTRWGQSSTLKTGNLSKSTEEFYKSLMCYDPIQIQELQ